MCNVQMIRNEPGLISIPLKRAVFCGNCERVSNSAWNRCGSCGSDNSLISCCCWEGRGIRDRELQRSPTRACGMQRELNS